MFIVTRQNDQLQVLFALITTLQACMISLKTVEQNVFTNNDVHVENM